MNTTAPKLKVGLVLTPRFTATEFSGFVDTLRLAADDGDRSLPIACAWSVLGRRGEPIVASCGATVTAWDDLAEPGRRLDGGYDHTRRSLTDIGFECGFADRARRADHTRAAASMSPVIKVVAIRFKAPVIFSPRL